MGDYLGDKRGELEIVPHELDETTSGGNKGVLKSGIERILFNAYLNNSFVKSR